MKNIIKKVILKYRLSNLDSYGEDVWVGKNSVLQGNIEVGSHVNIGRGAQFVSTMAKIHIHDYVVCGPNVTIYTGDHPMDVIGKHICEVTDADKIGLKGQYDKDVTIESGCWIGTRAIILKGVTIGRGSVIGAGAVVTKDIPPYSIFVGVGHCGEIMRRFNDEQIMEHEEILTKRNISINSMGGVKKLLKEIRNKKVKKNFKISAVVGAETKILYPASCLNDGVKEKIYIGSHSCISATLQALCGGKIKIGNNVYIGSHTVIQSKESIEIGNDVIISNGVLIVDNNNHPVEPEARLEMSQCDDFLTDEKWTWKYAKSKPIKICDNVWIGKNAVIMKGVTVGKGAVVALGAIVVHDVPEYTVVAGNPARVVKELK